MTVSAKAGKLGGGPRPSRRTSSTAQKSRAVSSEVEDLRKCPMCDTPVKDTVSLGLRDYASWLTGFLPGKVSGSDVDFLLEQASTGRILVHEYKPKRGGLGMGQRLLLKRLVSLGIDVWIVWGPYEEDGQELVTVGVLDKAGKVRFKEEMLKDQLGSKVREWWDDGKDEA